MDEARIIAWIDGALPPDEARAVAEAVAADPALAALADAHRRLNARLAAAFGPIAAEPALPETPPAEIVSLADARAARAARAGRAGGRSRWALPGAIAASLMIGALGGQQLLVASNGIGDDSHALALAPAIARALDGQRSGQASPIRVALSFRDRGGAYCRSFTGARIAGIACRAPEGWRLRYAAPADPVASGDYRTAGADAVGAELVQTMIAGDPLDAAQESRAIAAGWR